MGILNGGALHRAPLQTPQRILDIGTGTGRWAIDMGKMLSTEELMHANTFAGDEYPSAEVIAPLHSPVLFSVSYSN